MAEFPEPLEQLDIKIVRGAKFSFEVSVSNGGVAWTALSSATITGVILKNLDDSEPMATFTITPNVTDTQKFTVSMSATETAELKGSFSGSRTFEMVIGTYIIKADFGAGEVTRLLQGNVTLVRG